MQKSATSEAPQASQAQVSARKAAANRANAQRSTGPRTPAGKAASSLNALRHGILARAAFNVTLEGEERRAEFEELVAGLAQEFQPRTMSEHMTVQQLAGCYWKLAKVWTFETESAWRSNFANNLGLGEFGALEKAGFSKVVDEVMEDQDELFPEAGLGNPTIPTGPSASTLLRYQGAINTMLFRCLAILERRRKERMQAEETFAELDYINEPTAEAEASSEASAEASEPDGPAEKSAAPSDAADLPKRTQKDPADAPLSSNEAAKSDLDMAAADAASTKDREETA